MEAFLIFEMSQGVHFKFPMMFLGNVGISYLKFNNDWYLFEEMWLIFYTIVGIYFSVVTRMLHVFEVHK